MPDMIVDYDMSRKRFSIVQQEEVQSVTSGLDVNQSFGLKHDEKENVQYSELQRWKDFSHAYHCERKEVISHDGARVSLTILYSRTAWQKGQSPGILQGYGAYGEVLDKSWCSNRLSLLDRGWVVAFADVRCFYQICSTFSMITRDSNKFKLSCSTNLQLSFKSELQFCMNTFRFCYN